MASLVTGRVIRIAAIAVIFGGVLLAQNAERPAAVFRDAVVLASAATFRLTGAVGNLAPGVPARLLLRATNSGDAPIIVRTVTVTVRTPPSGCPVRYLRADGKAFRGRPPAVTITGLAYLVPSGGSARIPVRIRLARRAANGCQLARFPFRYRGTAGSFWPLTWRSAVRPG